MSKEEFLLAAKKELEWACQFYCDWYAGKIENLPASEASFVAYELKTACAIALKALGEMK